MALDESTRHALHSRLAEVLGPEHAVAAMTAYDRPFEWAEVATKDDLADLEERLVLRMDAMLHREVGTVYGAIGNVQAAIGSQTRSLVIAVVGAMIANASLTIGALALTG